MTTPPRLPKPPRRLPTHANQREIGAITDLLLDMDQGQLTAVLQLARLIDDPQRRQLVADLLALSERAEQVVVARERQDGRPALRIVGREKSIPQNR